MKYFLSRVSRRPRLAGSGKTLKPDANDVQCRPITLLQRFFAGFFSLGVGQQAVGAHIISASQRLDRGQRALDKDQVGHADCAPISKNFNGATVDDGAGIYFAGWDWNLLQGRRIEIAPGV